MRKLTIGSVVFLLSGIGAGDLCEAQIEPTWESMAANYQTPQWFVDGKLGVWMHWGVPSAIDENRPNDGSHYGRRMYGPSQGETGGQLKMTQTLSDWHVRRYGDPSEFGYEDLVPLFKAEKWDPDALVKFFKDNGARFIMPVACHHDKGLGIKLFTDYLNRDLKENDGKQTVVLSFKSGNVDRRAFTYNLERGSTADIKPEPWMWATDLSGGWFYRKGAVNRMSIPVMVGNAVDAISKNAVVMLNVALRGDGTLPENQAAYLTAFGDFLNINSEGIYGTGPWKTFGEGPLKMKDGRQGENHREFSQQDIRFTQKDGQLFVFVLALPTEDIVIKTLCTNGPLDGEITGIELLGSQESIRWRRTAEALTIQLPKTLPGELVNCFKVKLRSQGKVD